MSGLTKLFNQTALRYKRYFFNLGASFMSQAVGAVSIILLNPILLHSLGEEGYGYYGILLNLILFSAVFDLGLNTGLLRKLIHEKGSVNELLSSIFFFFILLLLAGIPAFYLLFKFEVFKIDQRHLLAGIFTALIVAQNMVAVFFEMMIQSANKIFVGRVIRTIKTIVEFFVLYYLSSWGSIAFLLLGSATVNILLILVLAYYAKKEVPFRISLSLFQWKTLVSHIRYCFWYFQTTVSSVLVYNAQIIMVSYLVSPMVISRYYMVMRFFEVIRTGMGNFTMILFPSLAMLQAADNWPRLYQTFIKVMIRVGLMVALAFLVVITLGEYFFVQWSHFGDVDTILVFRWYAVLISLLLLEHVAVVFLSALKFNKLPAIIGTLQGLLGLLLTYVLVPHYGIVGVVISSVIALLLTNFFFNPVYLIGKIKQRLNADELKDGRSGNEA